MKRCDKDVLETDDNDYGRGCIKRIERDAMYRHNYMLAQARLVNTCKKSEPPKGYDPNEFFHYNEMVFHYKWRAKYGSKVDAGDDEKEWIRRNIRKGAYADPETGVVWFHNYLCPFPGRKGLVNWAFSPDDIECWSFKDEESRAFLFKKLGPWLTFKFKNAVRVIAGRWISHEFREEDVQYL